MAGFVPATRLHWSQTTAAYAGLATHLLAWKIVKDRPQPGAYLFSWNLILPALWIVPVVWSVF
ncbi:hypothetical protein ABZ847_11215 [Streptomyces bauhiniae]